MLTERKPEPATVAVIMATYNRAHLISEAIDSILSQTRPPDEFIIVNDGSTDGTAEIIRSYGHRIKYIEKANGGKPSALNLALPQVDSAYTWIFDDDDVALPNALEAHLKFLSEHPQYDFTYSTNYVFSGDFSDDALRRAKLKIFPPITDAEYFLWIMESPFLPSLMPGMLIPTHCYRIAGMFDEDLIRGQDCDMVLRIARRFRAGFIEQPTFAERLHDGERGPAFERHAEADRYQIWQRYKRQIFGKLRVSLSLREYLPNPGIPSTEPRSLNATETRYALLQRAVVMATHGLFPEAADDFLKYVDKFDSTPAKLSDKERRHISALTYVHGPEAVPPSQYYRCLGAISRGRPELFRAVIRGLYWSITREVHQRRLALASRLLSLGAVLGGAYAGIPGTGRRRPHEIR